MDKCDEKGCGNKAYREIYYCDEHCADIIACLRSGGHMLRFFFVCRKHLKKYKGKPGFSIQSITPEA